MTDAQNRAIEYAWQLLTERQQWAVILLPAGCDADCIVYPVNEGKVTIQ